MFPALVSSVEIRCCFAPCVKGTVHLCADFSTDDECKLLVKTGIYSLYHGLGHLVISWSVACGFFWTPGQTPSIGSCAGKCPIIAASQQVVSHFLRVMITFTSLILARRNATSLEIRQSPHLPFSSSARSSRALPALMDGHLQDPGPGRSYSFMEHSPCTKAFHSPCPSSSFPDASVWRL